MNKQKSLGAALVLQLLLYCIYSVIMYLTRSLGDTAAGILSCILYAAVLALPILLYIKLTKTDMLKLMYTGNERTHSLPNLILMLVFAFAMTVTAVNLFSMATEALLGAPALAEQMGVSDFILLFIRNVLFAAILEELLFRGVVFNALDGKLRIQKILLSALLFALMHCSLRSFLYAFAAGVVIAYFTLKTNSVLFGAALHFAQNLCTFVFSVMKQKLSVSAFKTVSDISFWSLLAIAAIGAFTAVIFELKHKTIAPATDKTAKTATFFRPEVIAYILASAIITIFNH